MHALSGITTLLLHYVTNRNLTKNEHYELFMATKLKGKNLVFRPSF